MANIHKHNAQRRFRESDQPVKQVGWRWNVVRKRYELIVEVGTHRLIVNQIEAEEIMAGWRKAIAEEFTA